jgi:hypothetical protein
MLGFDPDQYGSGELRFGGLSRGKCPHTNFYTYFTVVQKIALTAIVDQAHN